MHRDDLKIPEPCHADWEAMHGDDRKRFCDSCSKHVHNLSEMTRSEATSLLDTRTSSSHLCVQYTCSTQGEVFFRDSTHPAWRLNRQVEGARRLLAAALTLPLLAACEPQDPKHDPNAVSPIVINPNGTLVTQNPGAGLAPTFTPPGTETVRGEPMAVEPPTQPDDTLEMIQGEAPAYEPEHDPEVSMGKVALPDDSETPTAPHNVVEPQKACDPQGEEQAEGEQHGSNSTSENVAAELPQPMHQLRGRVAYNPKVEKKKAPPKAETVVPEKPKEKGEEFIEVMGDVAFEE